MYLKTHIDEELNCCRSCNSWLMDFNNYRIGVCSVRQEEGLEEVETAETQTCEYFSWTIEEEGDIL